MNSEKPGKQKVLILGVGNTLLQDDGAGIHVARSLGSLAEQIPGISIIDGGTLGLSLLPEIEAAHALIVVDAGEIGARPGVIRVFKNEEMDRQLAGKKSSVHELAVADLLAAAAMSGTGPAESALVAIQPACTDWGLDPSPEVRAAIPMACELVEKMAMEWNR